MAGHGKGDPRKVVLAALVGNGAIGVCKFVAAFLSGSVTMLAEAVHSVADTANQALLLLGLELSKKHEPDRYPLGRAAESYFWAFIVALMLFFVGGVYAIYEGVHKLAAGHGEPGSPVAPLIVLGLSIAFESASFMVALREFNLERGERPLTEALFGGKDPTIPVVLLEDSAAVLGRVIALVSVLASWWLGSTVPDAVGSVLIGLLLCTVGVALARDTRSLLIGEGVTAAVRCRLLELANGTDGIDAVTELLTMHLGPDTVVVALKVRFAAGMSVAEAEQVTDALEARVRAELPQMKQIFVEADSDHEPEHE
jgi:cation diffusion facilitator family transporter